MYRLQNFSLFITIIKQHGWTLLFLLIKKKVQNILNPKSTFELLKERKTLKWKN